MGQPDGDDYNLRVHDEKPTGNDIVLVLPAQGSDGKPAFPVLRRRGDSVEAGVLRELENGKPIHGEVVRLERRIEHPLLFDVETVTALPAPAGARSGPAQVATEEYRAHWDAIFNGGGADLDETETLN